MDKNSALCLQHPKRDQKCLNFYSGGGPETTSNPNVEDGGRALVPQKMALFTLQNTSPLQAL